MITASVAADVVAAHFIGTILGESDYWDVELLFDDLDFCREIDQLMFRCDMCGWWCEIGEMAEGDDVQICADCAN